MSTTRTTTLLGLTVVAIALLCLPVHADTITVDNVQFTASVSGTLASLQIQCLDASYCGNWYLGDVTLKGFTFTGSPTLGTAPSGYTVQNGGQDNNAVGNGGGCNSTQIGNAVCWSTSAPLTVQLGGSPLLFTANITDGGSFDGLHVQATAYNNSAGSQEGGGKVLAVSEDLLPGGGNGTTPVPEPGSMALLGTGLVALAGVLRRRMR